tara:strand:- start:348 stop:509 length:162 start_codon:yes stop_codon:yes gene_type:complete
MVLESTAKACWLASIENLELDFAPADSIATSDLCNFISDSPKKCGVSQKDTQV